MFLWFMQPDIWLTLITLTFLEIILGAIPGACGNGR